MKFYSKEYIDYIKDEIKRTENNEYLPYFKSKIEN